MKNTIHTIYLNVYHKCSSQYSTKVTSLVLSKDAEWERFTQRKSFVFVSFSQMCLWRSVLLWNCTSSVAERIDTATVSGILIFDCKHSSCVFLCWCVYNVYVFFTDTFWFKSLKESRNTVAYLQAYFYNFHLLFCLFFLCRSSSAVGVCGCVWLYAWQVFSSIVQQLLVILRIYVHNIQKQEIIECLQNSSYFWARCLNEKCVTTVIHIFLLTFPLFHRQLLWKVGNVGFPNTLFVVL